MTFDKMVSIRVGEDYSDLVPVAAAEVARQFRTVMEEPEFKNKFRLLVFAILEKPRASRGMDGGFAPFYREFGTYQP